MSKTHYSHYKQRNTQIARRNSKLFSLEFGGKTNYFIKYIQTDLCVRWRSRAFAWWRIIGICTDSSSSRGCRCFIEFGFIICFKIEVNSHYTIHEIFKLLSTSVIWQMQLNATINWHQCGSMLFEPAYIEINMNVRREDEKSVHQRIHTDTESQSHRQTTTTTKIDSMKTNWLFASLMACHEYKFFM